MHTRQSTKIQVFKHLQQNEVPANKLSEEHFKHPKHKLTVSTKHLEKLNL